MIKPKIKIGDLLLKAEAINAAQLQEALALQEKKRGKLGGILIELGFINENQLTSILAEQLKIPFVDLNSFSINYNLVKEIPEKIARRFKLLVLEFKNNNYTVGMVEPTDLLAYDAIVKILGSNINIVLIKESSLLMVLDLIYRRTEDITSFATELKDELIKEKLISNSNEEILTNSENSPVAKLLDSIFEDAIQIGSSDIHIEPEANLVRIRQRVDGVLQENIINNRQIADPLILRIKLLARLNISEKRTPQDGRFIFKIKGKTIDVRASVMPIRYGETAVLRLLDQSSGILELKNLIGQKDVLESLNYHIHRPNGLILLTGPTGSGKTTTLYSILHELNTAEKKIISIEDPIEYTLPRITQFQVNPSIELTFAKILRSVLRQNPEIIMLGEMRDEETAQIGLRAAMTGHLVFSTLHTNNAISAATRFIDMGIPAYMVGSTLRAVIAQRLIRKNCLGCIKEAPITELQSNILKSIIKDPNPNWKFKQGSGCATCNNTGYKGRLAIYELMEMNSELVSALNGNNATLFNKTAINQKKFKPLVHNMLDCALTGKTSLDEILKMAVESVETIQNIEELKNTEKTLNINPNSSKS